MEWMEELGGIFETFYWIMAFAVVIGGGFYLEKRRKKNLNKKAH
ncbi:MAG: hypothetical protein AAB527_03895 [Patescibacteria group bacterium]